MNLANDLSNGGGLLGAVERAAAILDPKAVMRIFHDDKAQKPRDKS